MKTDLLEVSSLSAIEHLLTHRPDRIRKIRVDPKTNNARIGAVVEKAKQQEIPIENVRKNTQSESVVAELAPFVFLELKAFLTKVEGAPRGLVLALDHLQDPHNFGAICRTADAFGALGILLPKDRSVSVSSGTYNSSVGAVDTIPIVQVSNLSDALRKMKENGFWIVGTGIGNKAKPLKETPTFEKIVLVLGRELEGMSPHIENTCDWVAEIPIHGNVQSLNVSVAAGILIYELSKRMG